jgi:hypothetical protein
MGSNLIFHDNPEGYDNVVSMLSRDYGVEYSPARGAVASWLESDRATNDTMDATSCDGMVQVADVAEYVYSVKDFWGEA